MWTTDLELELFQLQRRQLQQRVLTRNARCTCESYEQRVGQLQHEILLTKVFLKEDLTAQERVVKQTLDAMRELFKQRRARLRDINAQMERLQSMKQEWEDIQLVDP